MSRQTNLFEFAFSSSGSRNSQRKPQDTQTTQRSSSSQPTAPSQLSSSSSFSSSSTTSRSQSRGGDRSNPSLAAVSAETRSVLPSILPNLPHLDASKSESLHLDYLPPLRAAACPAHAPGARVKIVNADTLNAAIDLAAQRPDGGRVAVLNMASDIHAGGGWLKGAVAQEEAICYRSSLYLSLHKRYYPFKRRGGVVLSVAAVRRPELRKTQVVTASGTEEAYEFAKAGDRAVTLDKMRLCLRMAASRGHSLLVLGALGCGAFRNPPEEVARCWLQVLGEAEFAGGWWREVWFAVYDRKNEGNFEVFEEYLSGVQV
ncbi:hypothetical protein CCHL11_02173 [Colletotrichum chlorophyti]|uniref:Microbial-type PARG catalytic domain-containing protein n=1 Tax=Colletotrichum chlorophyti TaxID=708187 RepID=A0A1Q8S6W3_9PEZI|nr:hypothetical protein CCHL11_02173 [Colletotrichum chlorophyti]